MPLCAEEIKKVPQAPGVYVFKDERGEVLYVGKAKDLRQRLLSYLRVENQSPKTQVLVARVEKFEFFLARSEKEALLLEANLIKKHRPRYNVVLRDDKAYPLLRLSWAETFPGIRVVRRRRRDKAVYFGPFPSAGAVRETLRCLSQLFPLRRCSTAEFRRRRRPCLYHQIGRCPAPCVGKISPQDYQRLVEGAVKFLRGKGHSLINELRQEMESCAERLEFERAAVLRDRILALQKTLETQVVSLTEDIDIDVFALARERDKVSGTVLFIRSGALIGKKNFHLSQGLEDLAELFSLLLRQFYDQGRYIPEEILLPVIPKDDKILEEWLTELAERRVCLRTPQRGPRKGLLEIAQRNALEALAARLKGERPYEELAQELKMKLRLPHLPRWVEGVDMSNLQGRAPVGAVVCFFDGLPEKTRYRRYHVRMVTGPDDYAMMYEVLKRHLLGRMKEGRLPDMLLIDGGKGQLQVACTVVQELGLESQVGLCALAKERKGEGEKIYIPRRKNPLRLSRHSEMLRFLQRVRDEAHRFAVGFHRKVRSKQALATVLDQIPGVGPKRRTTLLSHFGDIKALLQVPVEEIASLPGFNRKIATRVKEYLQESLRAKG